MKTSTCPQCLKAPLPKNRKYCSTSCQHDSMKKYPLSRTCEECDETFLINSSLEKTKRFCNKSCSSTFNNRIFVKRKKLVNPICGICGVAVSYGSKLCKEHYLSSKKEDRIISWISGEWSGGTKERNVLSSAVRNYLLKESNYSCSVCGFNEVHPDDGFPVLEIDHVNGDSSNHSPDNLRVLCPNHHALTSTYKNRNSGKGRKYVYYRKPV